MWLSHSLRTGVGRDILANDHTQQKDYEQICEGRKMKTVFLDGEEKVRIPGAFVHSFRKHSSTYSDLIRPLIPI